MSVWLCLCFRGYYPKGGGEVLVSVDPVKELRPVTLTERGSITKIHGRAFVAGVLPFKVKFPRTGSRVVLRRVVVVFVCWSEFVCLFVLSWRKTCRPPLFEPSGRKSKIFISTSSRCRRRRRLTGTAMASCKPRPTDDITTISVQRNTGENFLKRDGKHTTGRSTQGFNKNESS